MASSMPISIDFNFSQMRPSSPPDTPLSTSFHLPDTVLSHSPYAIPSSISPAQFSPGGHIEAIGIGPHFHFIRRPRLPGSSPKSSTASSVAPCESTDQSVVSDDDYKLKPRSRHISNRVVVVEGDFTIEEMGDSDESYDSDLEIIRPDHYEEADSDEAASPAKRACGQEDLEKMGIVKGLEGLFTRNTGQSPDQIRRYERKKKRWSFGIYKRTHSQSIGSDSDSDEEDIKHPDDVGSSARRLRRRLGSRGLSHRNSLVFDEAPTFNIAEVDESLYDTIDVQEEGTNNDGDDDGDFMRALPGWIFEDTMEIDSGPESDC
ncbi:MAG: hypothetical protein M1829_000365 [Trizodia sp. TS-e1964]|nr:MAG: hypothetical protein M1829_000365 [Trizodia sp. TS-e1964]